MRHWLATHKQAILNKKTHLLTGIDAYMEKNVGMLWLHEMSLQQEREK